MATGYFQKSILNHNVIIIIIICIACIPQCKLALSSFCQFTKFMLSASQRFS